MVKKPGKAVNVNCEQTPRKVFGNPDISRHSRLKMSEFKYILGHEGCMELKRAKKFGHHLWTAPKPKKGAFLSIKVVSYFLIFVEKWSKMPVFELIFHSWLLVNQN